MTIETLRKKTKMRIAVAALVVSAPVLLYSMSACAAENKSYNYELQVTAYSIEDGRVLDKLTKTCKKMEQCWFKFDNLVPCAASLSNVQGVVVWAPTSFVPNDLKEGVLNFSARVSGTGEDFSKSRMTDDEEPKELFLKGSDGKKHVRLNFEIVKPNKSFIDRIFKK